MTVTTIARAVIMTTMMMIAIDIVTCHHCRALVPSC